MEKGADSSSSGINVLDRKTSLNSDFLRPMKSTTTGSNMMAAHHQRSNPSHPFSLGDDDGAGSEGEVELRPAGPTTKSTVANEAVGTVYRDHVPSCDGGAVLDYCTTPYKYPAGGGMAAGFPFTVTQWKELERQAMVYKCMISSVSVPPHLLLPLPLDSSFPSVYGGRYSRKGDPEPGRCKRTDGKKWRCSREVAPQQKYCERHLHRGRPRSRKPVEPNNNNTTTQIHKKTRLQQTKTPPPPPNQFLKPLTNINIFTPYYEETNSLFAGGETASSKQPCEDLMGGFDRDYPLQEPLPLNLFSYPEMDLSTGFIDSWSIDNLNSRNDGGTVESEGDLSPSLDLSIAMAVGNVLDQNFQCECSDDFYATKWLSPVSWEPFALGGPLGEALQPGSIAGSRPASPYSNPATTASSPSGVLHRTLFSHSDGSVCNSPTFAAAPPEISDTFRL